MHQTQRFSSRFLLRNTLDAVDIFQKPLPAFNIRGRRYIPTIFGALMTFLIMVILLLYSTVKFIQLMSHHNPAVSSFLGRSVFDSSNELKFEEVGIRFAFGVEGFLDKELKDDSRFVKSFVRYWGYKNGQAYERLFPFHKCEQADFAKFPPPSPESVGLLEAYKSGLKRRLYCMDWEQLGKELAIWGVEEDEVKYQRFEFMLVPCNYVHTEFGDVGDKISEECIADRQQQIDYLGNMKLVIYTTEQIFNQQEYGKHTIETQSRFWTRQVDNSKPTWLDGRIMSNLLEDEVSYLQYGQQDERTFYNYQLSDVLPSGWINWPTPENPNNRYKYVSVEFNMSLDQMNWSRQTYSLLDWLGDLGGLLDILLHIGHLLVTPVASFSLHSTLMATFFRFKKKTSVAFFAEKKINKKKVGNDHNIDCTEDTPSLYESVRNEFLASERIPAMSFFRVHFMCCLGRSKIQRYSQILKKSKSRLLKEMDLQKFLHRQRVLVTALLGLLKGRHSSFVDKFSQLVIRELSDMQGTSSDDELSDWGKKPLQYVHKIASSKNEIDQRLLEIFKLRMAKPGTAKLPGRQAPPVEIQLEEEREPDDSDKSSQMPELQKPSFSSIDYVQRKKKAQRDKLANSRLMLIKEDKEDDMELELEDIAKHSEEIDYSSMLTNNQSQSKLTSFGTGSQILFVAPENRLKMSHSEYINAFAQVSDKLAHRPVKPKFNTRRKRIVK